LHDVERIERKAERAGDDALGGGVGAAGAEAQDEDRVKDLQDAAGDADAADLDHAPAVTFEQARERAAVEVMQVRGRMDHAPPTAAKPRHQAADVAGGDVEMRARCGDL